MVTVRFNKQIMRRGKIIPTGVPFEVDEAELPKLQIDGAVIVTQPPRPGILRRSETPGTLPPITVASVEQKEEKAQEEPKKEVAKPTAKSDKNKEAPKASKKLSLADVGKPNSK